LFLYVRPADMETSSFAQRFVQFMTSEAVFDIVDDAGFVALRPESRLSRNAANLSGCRFGTPEYAALMTVTQGATRLQVELHFKPRSRDLDDDANRYIAANAGAFRERLRRGETLILIGHADITGLYGSNRRLALQRASSARLAFEQFGVFGIIAESAGEACPADSNDTEEGRERNRRVEIWVRPLQSP
jgi:phosphate transport system substrate-binding protein